MKNDGKFKIRKHSGKILDNFSASEFTHDLHRMDSLLCRTFSDSSIDFFWLLSFNQGLLLWSLHSPHHNWMAWASGTLNLDNLCGCNVGHLHCLHHRIH